VSERVNLLPVVFCFDIAYFDGTAHRVRTRPGDLSRLEDEYGTGWRESENIGPKPMLYLAWLASRHDPTGLARTDFDAFRDDAISIEMEAEEVRPTGAAPGSASPSNSPSLPEPLRMDGSTPTPAPL
jgi:hypothetical protein